MTTKDLQIKTENPLSADIIEKIGILNVESKQYKEITSVEHRQEAITFIGKSKYLLKQIKQQRSDAKHPFQTAIKSIDGIVSPIVESIEKSMKVAVASYEKFDAEEKAKRDKEEMEIRKQEQKALENNDKKALNELAVRREDVAHTKTKQEGSTKITMSNITSVEITDEKALPLDVWQECATINKTKLKAYLQKNGDVSGAKLVKKSVPRISV